MIIGNNISPLPFYSSPAEWNHRKEYAFGQIYPLIAPIDTFLPFQFIVRGVKAQIYGVGIVDYRTGQSRRIDQEMDKAGLTITEYPGAEISVVSFSGGKPPGLSGYLSEGPHYLFISVSTSVGRYTYYSEVFTLRKNVSDYLKIEYSNSYDLEMKGGPIQFADGFKFVCYLDTQIGKPEYVFEEEATERMGYTFIESQVSKKIYKFTFLAPEYLCDALRIVRLCDTKRITSKGRTYDLTTFSMEPEWEEQGDLAAVECEFETDTVIANIGGYIKS